MRLTVDHLTPSAGLDDLIARLDAAIAGRTPEQACLAVASLLPLLAGSAATFLPPAAFAPVAGHYARRLLHVSQELGYSVVAMTWAPGQGTPIHDHDRQWCVDVVCQGRLQVTPYQVIEQDSNGWRFAAGPVEEVGLGQCSAVQPPHEHHRICNPDPQQVVVSLHVYQGQISRYTAFDPHGEQYLPREVVIWLD